MNSLLQFFFGSRQYLFYLNFFRLLIDFISLREVRHDSNFKKEIENLHHPDDYIYG